MSDLFPEEVMGNRPQIGPEDITPEEFEQLGMLIWEAVARGDDREEIIADLTSAGWEEEDAAQYVDEMTHAYHHAVAASSSQSDGGMGWLVWIGGLILFNVLSQVFGWGITLF